MRTVADALAMIPGRRGMLDRIDNELSAVITHVEEALCALAPGVPAEVSYGEGSRLFLRFGKHNGRWTITHGERGGGGADPCPLQSTARQVRAEAFTVDDETFEGSLAPIEQLIVAVVDSLERIAQDRSPQYEVAMRLRLTLERAGFEAPTANK